MDGIIQYLPNPLENPDFNLTDPETKSSISVSPDKSKLIALIFKVVNDPKVGLLCYLKIYSGMIRPKQSVYNESCEQEERIGQLLRMRANEYQETKMVSQGDIIAVTGLKVSASGETISGDRGMTDGKLLDSVNIPKPVFTSSLSIDDDKNKPKLIKALELLNKEDPSFSFEEDPDTNQLLIKGYGELHLEVMKDRIRSEYGVETFLTKLRVALRESVRVSEQIETKRLEKKLKDGLKFFELTLQIDSIDEAEEAENSESGKPKEKIMVVDRSIIFNLEEGNVLELAFFNSDMSLSFYKEFRESTKLPSNSEGKSGRLSNPEEALNPVSVTIEENPEPCFSIESLPFEYIYSMEQVLINSFARGPNRGKHLINTRVKVVGGLYSKTRTNEVIVNMCANQCVIEALKKSSAALMEPEVAIEINTPEENSQEIINNLLSQRGGHVNEVQTYMTEKKTKLNKRTVIKGTLPLQMTIGYSTYLRTVSHVWLCSLRAKRAS